MFTSETDRRKVVANNPGAAKIVKVEGGYLVFEHLSDYSTWRNQR